MSSESLYSESVESGNPVVYGPSDPVQPYEGSNEGSDCDDGEKPLYNVYDPNDASDPEIELLARTKPLWRKVSAVLRPGYILDFMDYKSFQVVIRTWLQIWVGVILSVVPRTSHWIGNAAYLMQIMGFIAVAGGSLVTTNFISSFICMFYAVAGWLVGIIAMKITHAIRGYPTKEEIVEIIMKDGYCSMGPSAGVEFNNCVMNVIFTGKFLETKTTVIYIFAIIIGFTLFGLTEKLHRLIRLGFITSVISLIINCCYGVFIPFFDPTSLGLAIIKPMGFAFALKTLLAAIIYPVTSSFQYFAVSNRVFKGLTQAAENNLRFIQTCKPSAPGFTNYMKYAKEVADTKGNVATGEFLASIMQLEVAISRFDLGDAGEFRSLLKGFVGTAGGYEYFYRLFQERKQFASNSFTNFGRRGSIASTTASMADRKVISTIHDSYRSVGAFENNRRINILKKRIATINPEDRVTLSDLDYIASFINKNFSPILEANLAGLVGITEWLEAANQFRTYAYFIPSSFKKHQAKQQECNQKIISLKARLESELENLDDHEKLETLFKTAKIQNEAFLNLITQTTLFLHFAKTNCKHILRIIDLFLSIDERRPTPSVIHYFTSTMRAKAQSFYDKEYPSDVILDFSDLENRRNPDSLPPATGYQRFGSKLLKVYKWLYNGHVWFWIRSGGLVCVSAIPYFCRTTSNWYFSWRLIWLVIMTGVSTAETTGQTIYVFGAKLMYTLFGCLLGGIGWYISTGSGHGNYYGYCAVSGVLYAFLSYYRHFSVHLSLVPQILFSVTTALVLGTSWVDSKYNKLANIGGGWRVALTRLVGVMIGLIVGSFACIFPKPKTSKTELRGILAGAIAEIGSIHCQVARFANLRFANHSIRILERHDQINEKFRKLSIDLGGISQLVVALQHEIPLSGYWPEARFTKLQACITDLLLLYFILYNIFNRIEDTDEMPTLLRRLAWSDADFTANLFSIIHMVSDSLYYKKPLPQITEASLTIKHYNSLMSQWEINRISLNERYYGPHNNAKCDHSSDEKGAEVETKRDDETDERFGESIIQNLNYKKYFSDDGQLKIVALLLVHIIYERLDEIMIIVKELVGERYIFDDTLFEDDPLLRMYD